MPTKFRTRLPLLGAVVLTMAVLTGAVYANYAVTSRVTATLASGQTSALAMGSASYSPSLTYGLSLANGTGNNQFTIVKADSGGIPASDSVMVDLAGTATDAFGAVITCTTMKGIMVTADSSNVTDVLVGGARVAQVDFLGNGLGGAADTNHLVPVGPGGVFLWIRPKTGATVTGTTRDIIRFKNSGATLAKYKSQILCR
jgi:hypothetical protein